MSQPIDPGGALELFASMGVSSLALTGVLINDHPIYSFIGCLTQLICYFVLIIPFQYLAFKTHVRSQIDTREGEAGVIGKDIDDPGTTQGCCRHTSGRMP